MPNTYPSIKNDEKVPALTISLFCTVGKSIFLLLKEG
jgi:hypothetical protein